MKVAVSSSGKDMNSRVDQRFGRAPFFVVVETESGEFTVHDNTQNLNALQGAGIQSAKNVVEMGAQAVLTGNMGPKAFSTLQVAGVSVYTGISGTIKDALETFKVGTLEKTGRPNVEGHWM